MNDQTILNPITSGCQDINRDGDIIFVHGLNGDAFKTWMPETTTIPEDSWLYWLGEDFPNVGVWSLGYNSTLTNFETNNIPLSLDDLSTLILDILELNEIGRRPLIFIGHHTGGILIKSILSKSRIKSNLDWKSISSRTQGIIFLSTPQLGCRVITFIQYLKSILPLNKAHLDGFTKNTLKTREIYDNFRNDEKLRQISIDVYYGNLKNSGILLLKADDVDPGIPDIEVIPINCDNISICKPKSRAEYIYKRVSKFISNSLFAVKTDITSEIKTELFIESTSIEQLKSFQNLKYDLTKVVRFCEEINSSFAAGNYLATIFLIRAFINHIPPIFSKEYTRFSQVISQVSKSRGDLFKPLENIPRKLGDLHSHDLIRHKEILLTKEKIEPFRVSFGVLLEEIIVEMERLKKLEN